MINEEDGSTYLGKYSQEVGGCQTESGTAEDNTAERILSDANDLSEENSMSRKPILEQDRFLPIANISRLMKNVIPRSGKVAKDAKECVQECVSEFISFITSEACDRCLNEKRKTITGEDIIGAFSTLGFDNYVEPLNAYVRKFREAFRTERNNETLLVEPSGSHPSFLEKMNVHDSNESAPSSDVFTIQSEPMPSSSTCAPQIIFAGEEDPDGAIRVISAGNVQHLQLLMDPATGQHYINVQNPNGTQQLLPVQVTAVADSSATPLTLACSDAQNLTDGKTVDKEMPNFSSKTEFRSSLAKSENMVSASYKELNFQVGFNVQNPNGTQQLLPVQVSHVTGHVGEHSSNGAAFGLKHAATGLSATNQHKQQVPYISGMEPFGHHQSSSSDSVIAREQPRKRSHESVDYISFE
uniref:Nuclear transcription factor Y subunit beta n=1 Tax=Setaria digitata TaxID=48799 RepID=A0A915PHY7_9BILA